MAKRRLRALTQTRQKTHVAAIPAWEPCVNDLHGWPDKLIRV